MSFLIKRATFLPKTVEGCLYGVIRLLDVRNLAICSCRKANILERNQFVLHSPYNKSVLRDNKNPGKGLWEI